APGRHRTRAGATPADHPQSRPGPVAAPGPGRATAGQLPAAGGPMAAPRLSLLLLALLGSAQARELPPTAYQQIARQAGIPAEILYAIALQESALLLRGQLRPWPWTLNVAGRP